MSTIMNKKIFPPQPSLQFINRVTGAVIGDFDVQLVDGLWQYFDVEAWMRSNKLHPSEIHKAQPLFSDIHHIKPGVKWSNATNSIELDLYHPKERKYSVDTLLEVSEKFFKSLNANRIGVHLSGGFDSSLIMCILHKLDIPFVPIGLKGDTFEFRTERLIQEDIASWGQDALLIGLDEVAFYSQIDKLPPHRIPCGIFKGYTGSCALADAFAERGCDVVLTGQGGDTLFVDKVKDIRDLSFNIGNEFENHEEQDLIYSARGIKLVSYFSQPEIINLISTARIGQPFDALKMWARHEFRDILPHRLVSHSYFADFFSLTRDGLMEARPIIARLLEEAYERLRHPIFSSKATKGLLNRNIYGFEYTDYIEFCSILAVAVWIHSLFNNE